MPVIFNVAYLGTAYIEIPVTATLYDSDGNVQDEKSLIFKSKRTFTLAIENESNYQKINTDLQYKDGEEYTSSNPTELDFIEYKGSYTVNGNTKPDSVKIKVNLKNNIYFDEAKNSDWIYDASTNTATLINNQPEYRKYEFSVYLKFPHWKYNEWSDSVYFSGVSIYQENEVAKASARYFRQNIGTLKLNKYMYMSDKGIALEGNGDFKELTYKQKSNYISHRETNKNKIVYSKMNIVDSVGFSTTLPNENEKKLTTNIYINQLVFGKDTIDLNFSKLYVDSSRITNDEIRDNFKKNNILYGVKEDDTKVEIARNIAMDQEIDIPSQTKETKYKTLQLEFPDSFKIVRKYENNKWDDRFDLDVYVGTKFFEEDWESLAGYQYDIKKRYIFQKVVYQSEKNGEDIEKNNNGTGYYYYDYFSSLGFVTDNQSVSVHYDSWSNSYSNMPEGTYRYIETSVYVSRTYYYDYKEDEKKHIKNGKMFYLLPKGYEHAQSEQTYLRYYKDGKSNNGYKYVYVVPKKIENYKSTGKTAYVIDLPDDLENYVDSSSITFNFPIISTINAPVGTSTIDVYFSWENNGSDELPGGNTNDVFDMNENGNVEDKIYKNSAYQPVFSYSQSVYLYPKTRSYTLVPKSFKYITPSIYISRGSYATKRYLKNGKMYFVCPKEYEYAKGQKTYIQYYDEEEKKYKDLEVEVETLDNFNNTGKSAYVMLLPDFSKIENSNDGREICFYFPIRPTNDAEEGEARVETYFSWSNNSDNEIFANRDSSISSSSYYSSIIRDTYDLNENGSTTDRILSTSYTLTFRYDQYLYFSRYYYSGDSYATFNAAKGKVNYIYPRIYIRRSNSENAKRYPSNGKMYFVVPKGYEYASKEKTYIRYYNDETEQYENYDTTVETITNFKETGQTAYVMSLPDLKKLENWNDEKEIMFYLPVIATVNAALGKSTVEVYFSWFNNSNNEMGAGGSPVDDVYDLNGNGSSADKIHKGLYYFNYSYDQSVRFNTSSNTSLMLGEHATISPNIKVERSISGVENRRIKNGKMYYVVPEGYEYAKGEKTALRYYDRVESKYKEVEVTPKAVYNFKNTGKTAYVLSLPELENWYDANSTFFDLPVRPTANAPQGQSTIDIYFAWDNNENQELFANGSYKTKDIYDLNGNGSTEDFVFYSTCTINYVSTIEVAGVHRVGNTLDGLNSSGSTIDLGSEFYYGMDILNLQNDTSVKSLSIMEILPYKNDKSIIPDKTGTYTERESQYRVHINGPVQVLKDGQLIDADEAGYEVVYSTETPESEGFSNNLNKTFTKTVDDWTKVTMFKITMKQGTEIAEKGSMRFVVKALVPEDDSINDDDIAKASFAYVSSSAAGANFRPTNYIETTSIATPVARYQISGNVYMDYNINGSHDSNEMVFDGLKVGLYDENDTEVAHTKTDTNGNYVFDFLKRGNYKVKLKEKPNGTEYPDETNHYDDIFPVAPQTRAAITGKNSLDKTGSSEVLTMDPDTKKRSLEMGLEAQLQEISVEKQWLGPEESNAVDVTLHGLDQEKQMTLTSDNGWTDTFVHLRKIDENGKAISYTLTEDTDIDGYIKKVEKNDQGFTVQNINTEKVNVPVEVRWIGQESKDTDITLVETKTKQTVTADDNWKYDFTDLYKYDQENGNEINYTIKAKNIEGYTKEITGDMKNGYVVTYTNVEKIKVPVTIKWLGKEGQEAEVTLVQENNKQTITADDNWKYSFKDLFKYDQTTGEVINYTIEAQDVEGYTKEITGDMTNGFVVIYRDQEKRNVSVSKQWVGEEKENVTVHLFKDRNEEEKMTLDSTNNWQGEFKDLYKYDQEDGHVIEYTIEEDEVEGYKTGISGNMDLGYTVTNTITGRVSIPVTKEFIGPQTENVTVDLYANDVKVDSIELNDTNHWQYTFTDKERYEDGKEIVYTIKEHEIDNYKSEITGNALDGYVITNTNVEKIKIPVTIKWIGKEGEKAETTIKDDTTERKESITNKDQWKYTYKGLYKYDQETGKEIEYIFEAQDVEGYTKEVTGNNEEGYTVTYRYVNKEKVEPTNKKPGIIERILGPKTGDQVMISGFVVIMLASLLGVFLLKKKRNK